MWFTKIKRHYSNLAFVQFLWLWVSMVKNKVLETIPHSKPALAAKSSEAGSEQVKSDFGGCDYPGVAEHTCPPRQPRTPTHPSPGNPSSAARAAQGPGLQAGEPPKPVPPRPPNLQPRVPLRPPDPTHCYAPFPSLRLRDPRRPTRRRPRPPCTRRSFYRSHRS